MYKNPEACEMSCGIMSCDLCPIGGEGATLPADRVEGDPQRRETFQHPHQSQRRGENLRFWHQRAPSRLCGEDNGCWLQAIHGGETVCPNCVLRIILKHLYIHLLLFFITYTYIHF